MIYQKKSEKEKAYNQARTHTKIVLPIGHS